MEEDMLQTEMTLSEFLENYGIKEEGLTSKEKLQILRQIILSHKVDKDLTDFSYSQKEVSEKTDEVIKEYVSTINNLDVKIISAMGYIVKIREIQKEERLQKRKQVIQKIFKGFKK